MSHKSSIDVFTSNHHTSGCEWKRVYARGYEGRRIDPRMNQILYTARQVSEMLNIPMRTLERWRYERANLPYVNFGGKTYYRRTDIERFINANLHPVREGRDM